MVKTDKNLDVFVLLRELEDRDLIELIYEEKPTVIHDSEQETDELRTVQQQAFYRFNYPFMRDTLY
jgi:succinate dehydrogenase flavin-adding protein (antitoxin of CptAB toxin-antitoxin module)